MTDSVVQTLQSSLVILISLIVGVLIAQTILMGVFVLAMRKFTDSASQKIDTLTSSTLPALQSMRDLIEESRNRFRTIGANIEEISALTRRQVQRVDGVVGDATEAHMRGLRGIEHQRNQRGDRRNHRVPEGTGKGEPEPVAAAFGQRQSPGREHHTAGAGPQLAAANPAQRCCRQIQLECIASHRQLHPHALQ